MQAARKLLPSKQQWYLNLRTSNHGQPPMWAHFKDEFLREHDRIAPAEKDAHALQCLVNRRASSKLSVQDYVDRFRELVSRRQDAQTSKNVMRMFIFGLRVKKLQEELREAMPRDNRDAASLDAMMTFVTNGDFIYQTGQAMAQAPTTTAADPMQLGVMS
eukprot:358532-Chlamydomonas_euryale.AAC.9